MTLDNHAALQARELVLEKARDPELEYIFKHALVQEATYDSILLRRRRDLHARVGAAVETLFADRCESRFPHECRRRGGHARKSREAALSGRRNHPGGRGAAALARTALDSAVRAIPPSLGDAAVLDDLDSIPPPEEAVETLVEPIARRARHYEPVHGGVDIRIHVAAIPTASVHDVVAL